MELTPFLLYEDMPRNAAVLRTGMMTMLCVKTIHRSVRPQYI
jgi:hypothetical protein